MIVDFAHHNTERTCKESDKIVQSFWYWNSIIPYINCIGLIVAILIALTLLFKNYEVYGMVLGTLSAMIEV